MRELPPALPNLPCLRLRLGGVAAATFLIYPRASSRPDHALELYVPSAHYHHVLGRLILEQRVSRAAAPPPKVQFQPMVEGYSLLTSTLRPIAVWQIRGCTALPAVVGAGQTAKVNFISGDTLGCAFPSLTLAGVTVWGYARPIPSASPESSFWRTLALRPQLDSGPVNRLNYWDDACLRRRYLCLNQCRRFADDGSVTFQFGPWSTEHDYRLLSYWWRLPTRYDCPSSCRADQSFGPLYVV